jgi:hypothetical protein
MPDGSTVYDGYLLHGGGISAGLTPIHQCATPIPNQDPRVTLQGSGAPILRFQSYTDFNTNAFAARREDSDSPNDRYRLYELAGPPHNTLYVAYFAPSETDLQKLNYFQTIYRCEPNQDSKPPAYANDFPTHYLLNGGWNNLYRWVEQGIAPPKADRIHTQFVNGKNVALLDQFGNPVGGVRTPYLDVPTATYTPGPAQDKPAYAGSGKCWLWGSTIPFSPERMKSLYKNHRQYVNKVAQAVDDLVRNGWVTPEDARRMKTAAARSSVPKAAPALIKPDGARYPWPDNYEEWVAAGKP